MMNSHNDSAANGGPSASQPATSEAQRRANRQNAQHSTGPKTLAGKSRVAQNAMTHGLFAVNPCLDDEQQRAFDITRALLMDELQPATPLQCTLVEQIVVSMWRMNRLIEVENTLYSDFWWGKQPGKEHLIKQLERLSLYECRIRRQSNQLLRELAQRQGRTQPLKVEQVMSMHRQLGEDHPLVKTRLKELEDYDQYQAELQGNNDPVLSEQAEPAPSEQVKPGASVLSVFGYRHPARDEVADLYAGDMSDIPPDWDIGFVFSDPGDPGGPPPLPESA